MKMIIQKNKKSKTVFYCTTPQLAHVCSQALRKAFLYLVRVILSRDLKKNLSTIQAVGS